MEHVMELLPNFPLAGDGTMTSLSRAVGIRDFAAAVHYVWQLPYGRIADRARLGLVLSEGRETCTTKHALLALLAREHGVDVTLTLGIYEMNQSNTPGVGPVLAKYGLASLPEAHCYLTHRGARVDVTRAVGEAAPIDAFLHEEPITPDQIGSYKIDLHRRFLAEWITRSGAAGGRSLEEIWRIREECIAALSVA